MKLRSIPLAGFPCDVHVDAGGTFTVTRAGQDRAVGRGETLADALGTAQRALARTKLSVSVPFYTMDGERGEATGRHAGTGKILARVGGETRQLNDDWNRREYLSGDTPQEVIDEYIRLREQQSETYSRLKEIEHKHPLDLGRTVNAALERELEQAQ